LLHGMLLRRPLLRRRLPLGSRRTLWSNSFRRRDTRRAWRGWRAGRRCWRRFLTRGRRFLTRSRRFLTRSTRYEQRRHDRKKIQPISPTHQILRACNQQVAASSQQKERLSPHSDRQAPLRRCGRIVAAARDSRVRKACQTTPYTVDISSPSYMARAPNKRPASVSPELPCIRTARGLDAPP
jgi:hypothetical protein